MYWSLSAFNVLVISTFDSLACFSCPFLDGRNRIAISRAEVCALTHIAVGSDLRQCVIYNDDEQRRDTFLGKPVRVNKSYASDRNSKEA